MSKYVDRCNPHNPSCSGDMIFTIWKGYHTIVHCKSHWAIVVMRKHYEIISEEEFYALRILRE
jgi:hypothetical protein